jgi:hypothetical protein
VLFSVRRKLGELFGWDKPDTGIGGRVQTAVGVTRSEVTAEQCSP